MDEEILLATNGSLDLQEDESMQINDAVKEDNLNIDFLKDFDTYWDDVNNRLTISRVVNESIVRGMVNAIESEAAETIAQKELEIARLRDRLPLYHVGSEASSELVSLGKNQDSFECLKIAVRSQLEILTEELGEIKQFHHVNRSEKWVNVDKILDSLQSVIGDETDPFMLRKRNHECEDEIERIVFGSYIRSLKEEYEERLRERDKEFGGNKSLLLKKINEITDLRGELQLMAKSLSGHENGGAETVEERLHRKISGCYISPASLSDMNREVPVTSIAENHDALKHLNYDDLIIHFNTKINQMKLDHDYKIQEMTETYYSLKREYLKLQERGPSLQVKREKEIDALRKKIPDVISKLDKILLQDEKSVSAGKNSSCLQSDLDSLLLENRKLRDSLVELKRENREHPVMIGKLESEIEYLKIEAFISEKVYGCVLGEFVDHISCGKEERALENLIIGDIYGLISKDIISRQARVIDDDFEDSCVVSLISEDLCALIYKEAIKEAYEKLEDLNLKYICESNALEMNVSENTRLKQEIDSLEFIVNEKERLVAEINDSLADERKRLKRASREILDLKEEIERRDKAIVEKIRNYEAGLSDLRRDLGLSRENAEKIENEKMMILDSKHETEKKLSVKQEDEKKLRKQIDVISSELIKRFDDFELIVAEKSKKTNSRLKNLQNQLNDVSMEADELKEKTLMYKQKLAKKCSDLQKAEAEVDVLGDEVESLSDLLEKIYIALDHYSPILKHYPGIIEILKLVMRELSGDSRRSV